MENEKIIQPPTSAPVNEQAPSVSPTPPKSSISRLMILVILFIIIVAVGLGVYILALKYAPLPPNFPPQPTPLAVTQPTPSPDPTANWKTYTSSPYGFTFKYPDNFQVSERVNGFFVVTTLNENVPEAGISIDARLQGIYQDYDKAISSITSSLEISQNSMFGIWNIYIGKGTGMVTNIEFKRAIIHYKTGALGIEMINKEPYNLYFDQILSTFKFTDQSPDISNQACGGPLAVEPNQGCPAGYSCGDITTAGGETSGKCLKN